MVSLPDGEKISKIYFIRFDVIYERDGRTDGQIQTVLHDSKDRAYASHRAVKTDACTYASLSVSLLTTSSRLSNYFLLYSDRSSVSPPLSTRMLCLALALSWCKRRL